ncbi:MAG: hypothetical protein ABGY95_04690 [Rubritalea sp.]|mgnify:CR=1 FL=1|uniref:hypothetical protein n=1 Tax=Rubritalea sp. TaxID=2109375 RepID=UPI003242B3A5
MVIRIICVLSILLSTLGPAADLGKEVIGRMQVQVIFATNGEPSIAAKGLKKPSTEVEKKLKTLRKTSFKHYRVLGMDRQPVFRSYENWLTPLKPSEELLLSFEPRGKAQSSKMMLDLELWQSRKKIMKAGPTLEKGKPLYIFGPKWRGGRLLLAIELVELLQ